MPTLPRLSLVCLAGAGLVLVSACEITPLPVAREGAPAPVTLDLNTLPEQPLASTLLEPAQTPFLLGPGDKLQIEVMGDIATRTTATVGPDGKIYYNILPGIDVWGLTLHEARDRIETGLNQFIRERPVVALELLSVQSKKVWLLGSLNSPGVYPLSVPTSLLDAVAEAGGLGVNTPAGGMYSESADLSRSFLVRDGHIIPVDFQRLLREGDLSQNVYLQPDDLVFVPSLRSAQVHILGAVLQPQSERMRGSLTLVQAIALAGGSVPGASLPNVAILRGSLVHPQIAIVAVNKVLNGRAPDVRLEPGDIVYVPYTPERVLERYALLIVDTFVRTVGVNEGAYTISNKATPLAVGVNLAP